VDPRLLFVFVCFCLIYPRQIWAGSLWASNHRLPNHMRRGERSGTEILSHIPAEWVDRFRLAGLKLRFGYEPLDVKAWLALVMSLVSVSAALGGMQMTHSIASLVLAAAFYNSSAQSRQPRLYSPDRLQLVASNFVEKCDVCVHVLRHSSTLDVQKDSIARTEIYMAHGFGASSLQFAECMLAESLNGEVFAYDHLGFGLTQRSPHLHRRKYLLRHSGQVLGALVTSSYMRKLAETRWILHCPHTSGCAHRPLDGSNCRFVRCPRLAPPPPGEVFSCSSVPSTSADKLRTPPSSKSSPLFAGSSRCATQSSPVCTCKASAAFSTVADGGTSVLPATPASV
jgi:hypothetical protein